PQRTVVVDRCIGERGLDLRRGPGGRVALAEQDPDHVVRGAPWHRLRRQCFGDRGGGGTGAHDVLVGGQLLGLDLQGESVDQAHEADHALGGGPQVLLHVGGGVVGVLVPAGGDGGEDRAH